MVGKAAAESPPFAVRGRIVVGPSEIAPARENLSVADDHRAERVVALPRLIERHAHESLILWGGIGRGNWRSGGHHGGGAECNHNAAPAVKDRNHVRRRDDREDRS